MAEHRKYQVTITYLITERVGSRPGIPQAGLYSYLWTDEPVEMETKYPPTLENIDYTPELFTKLGINDFKPVRVIAKVLPRK